MAGFPNSPSLNDTYTLGDKTWEWDGTMWRIKTTGAVGPQGNQGNQGNAGSAGNAGVQGPQGNQGRQGNQGNAGSAGSAGVQGPQGNQGRQGNQGNQGPGLSISTPTSQTGDFLFGNSSTAYRNSYFSSDSDGIPLIQNYGEKAFDNGTADSGGGETFSINLDNGLIHYADMSTGATSYTYSFSITGYSSETTSFALILRGGQDLTINWTDISWNSDGAPDFSSATAGVYSVIPFYRMTTPSLGWLGGSSSTYNA